jgi:hypothetical protein
MFQRASLQRLTEPTIMARSSAPSSCLQPFVGTSPMLAMAAFKTIQYGDMLLKWMHLYRSRNVLE